MFYLLPTCHCSPQPTPSIPDHKTWQKTSGDYIIPFLIIRWSPWFQKFTIFAQQTGPRTKSFGANILPSFFLAPRLRLNLKTTRGRKNGDICAWTCTSALMSLQLANLAEKRHKSSPRRTQQTPYPFFGAEVFYI